MAGMLARWLTGNLESRLAGKSDGRMDGQSESQSAGWLESHLHRAIFPKLCLGKTSEKTCAVHLVSNRRCGEAIRRTQSDS